MKGREGITNPVMRIERFGDEDIFEFEFAERNLIFFVSTIAIPLVMMAVYIYIPMAWIIT